jgi:isopenicillin N synthase-like dioxygenase
MTLQLPVIDLAALAPATAGRERELERLRQAAHRFGFFQLGGHGVASGVDQMLRQQARQLFALPDADKQAIAMLGSAQFRGYTRPGAELTGGRGDWREQIDLGREAPALDADALKAPGAVPALRLHGPNQWPQALPAFRAAVQAWQQAMEEVLLRVLEACAETLGQPRGIFSPLYRDQPWWTMKLIRYPGQAQAQQGVGAHKDGELLSLIAQDRTGGLQVETADGRWIDAQPLPGCYVVNVGEQLELASDGYFKAAVHRVRSPAAGTERLSAAFFLGARLDSRIPALTLPPALAAQATGYTRDPANPLLHDVGANTLKGRLRSHPDVARVHHADLLESCG